MAAVWLLCGAAYWAAAVHSAPPAAALQAAPAQAGVPLDAFTYSLGRLLPLVDLGPAQAWSTGSAWAGALNWLSRFESAFGWLAALLLVASVAGWVDRDRRT
jgi:hypothetical protein